MKSLFLLVFASLGASALGNLQMKAAGLLGSPLGVKALTPAQEVPYFWVWFLLLLLACAWLARQERHQ